MFMETNEEQHREMMRLLNENNSLLKDNNRILRILHRNAIIEFILRAVWYGLLIGLPFALYFYVFQPYFKAMGANYEVFRQGINEVPGLKGIESLLPSLHK